MSAAIRNYQRSGGGVPRHLINLAAALMLGAGVALMLGIRGGATFLPPRDPILLVSTHGVLSVFAGLSLAVGMFCLLGKPSITRALLIVWWALNAGVYALALRWDGHPEVFSAGLDSLARAFRLPPATAACLAAGLIAILLLAGLSSLLWLHFAGKLARPESSHKMPCPACGGHIAFDSRNLGQSIPCPHCQRQITLRTLENLRMSCYFCRGHIEFPMHAIGTRLPCPHCKMDITLKEQNKGQP